MSKTPNETLCFLVYQMTLRCVHSSNKANYSSETVTEFLWVAKPWNEEKCGKEKETVYWYRKHAAPWAVGVNYNKLWNRVGAGITQRYSAGVRAGWSGVSSSGRDLEFFSSSPRPDRLWGSLSLLSNG